VCSYQFLNYIFSKDFPTVAKPIMESIDGISKSCLATLELMGDQNFQSKLLYEKLGSLIDYNQVNYYSQT
jgi:hypothetical protein